MYCYPGGTECPLGDGGGGNPPFRTYLAYRWFDADGDGLTDLVAAVHGDIDWYDIEKGTPSMVGTTFEPQLFGPWPACPGQADRCKNLGDCLKGAQDCTGGPCTMNWGAVNTCLSQPTTAGCFQVIARPNNTTPNPPSHRGPYMRCDGLYPWFIYKNQGNGVFPAFPTIKYQPVPLESDSGDSAIAGPGFAGADHAVMDFDGDGIPDVIAHPKDDPNATPPVLANSDNWFVWLGDGTGGFGPKRYTIPTRPHQIGSLYNQNAISGNSALLGSNGVISSSMGIFDANGDGLPDHWRANTTPNASNANIAYSDGTQQRLVSAAAVGELDTPQLTPPLPFYIRPSNDTAASNVVADSGHSILSGDTTAANRTLDVDNDGLVDLVQWPTPGTGVASVYFNLGAQFGTGAAYPGNDVGAARKMSATVVPAEPNTTVNETMIWELRSEMMDLDADGVAESAYFAGAANTTFFDSTRTPLGPPRVLTKVKNGRGLETSIAYASMHETDALGVPYVEQNPGQTWFDGRPKATPRSQWVVKSLTVHDNFPASDATTSYRYRNPRHGADDAGYYAFRGFEEVTATGPSGAQTLSRYGYDVDWSGRLTDSITRPMQGTETTVVGEVRTIDHTTWTGFSLFGGAIKSYHATDARHYTCQDGKDEAACTAGISGWAGFTESISTFTPYASTTALGGPALMLVETAVRSQHALSAANGDRVVTRTFNLNADGSTYRLRPDRVTKQSQVGGAMVTYAMSRTTWDATAPSYARKLTDEVWVDSVDANRAITHYVYEGQTGNLMSVQTPNLNTTSYEYDARRLFVSAENNPLYNHNLEFDYEYGTGTKTTTRGPNIAWCAQYNPPLCPPGPNVLVRDANKIVIDGFGRTIERWESINVDPSLQWFELRKVETNSYVDTAPPSVTHQAALKEAGGVITYTQDKTELDGHGRPTKKTIYALGAAVADNITSFHYRADGTLQDVTVPDPTANNASTVTYTYTFDSLGRPTGIRRPDATITVNQSGVNIAYSGLLKTTTEVAPVGSAKTAVTKTTVDADGRLVRVEEEIATTPTVTWATTLYAYSPDDNVQQITDPENRITTMTHDFAGHRTQIIRGTRTWSYAYDPDGNLQSETTPCTGTSCLATNTTYVVFDALDRPTQKQIAPRTLLGPDLDLFGAKQETFVWDSGSNARGRLSQWITSGPSATEVQLQWLAYDPQGRELSNFNRFTAAGYAQVARSMLHGYLLGGRPSYTQYLDNTTGGAQFTFSTIDYDARGLPSTLWISADRGVTFQPGVVETRNVAGLVTKRRTDLTGPMTFLESNWTYDKIGRVTSQVVQKGPGPTQVARQDLTYFGTDDPNTLATSLGTATKTQTFAYDNRHQLTNVTTATPGYFTGTYAYGAAGRFARATEAQTITPLPLGTEVKPRNVNYNYAGPDPEQVTSLTNVSGGATFATYTYDDAGNQLTRSYPATGESWTYLYDGKDQLRRATKKLNNVVTGSEEYWYDNTGKRTQVLKRDAAGAKTELVWFIEDAETHVDPAGTVTHAFTNISMGTPVARLDRTSDTAVATEYQFHGLANSTLAAVAQGGTINASFSYAPFGEVVEATNAGGTSAGTAVHKRRFNDKQQDDLTALTYYGARYYDKTLMAWTQADPLYLRLPDLAKQSTPRRSSLQVFSLNNPLRYLDPDGRDPRQPALDEGRACPTCDGADAKSFSSVMEGQARTQTAILATDASAAAAVAAVNASKAGFCAECFILGIFVSAFTGNYAALDDSQDRAKNASGGGPVADPGILPGVLPNVAGSGTAAGATNEAPQLPAYKEGGKTSGVLRTAAGDTRLTSGYKGPSASMPLGTPGMNGNIKSHVEAHAAAIMRREGIGEGTLFINRVPCSGKTGCGAMLPRMLPEGGTLRVLGPGGYDTTFVGKRD